MTKLESIVVSNTEPNSKNVLWYDNKRLLIFSNGSWSPIVDLDDIDVDNLPGVSNLQEALKSLNIKVDNKVDKTELDVVLTSKQDKLVNSADVTVGEDDKLTVTEEAKRKAFDDLWISAAGSFGTVDHTHTEGNVSKPYYLNEVWMTYEEALVVYNEYYADKRSLYEREVYGVTNLPTPGNGAAIVYSNFVADNAVTINVGDNFRVSAFVGWLYSSQKLTKIIGQINLQYWKPAQNSYNYLTCPNLKEVSLYHLSKDFNISSLKSISLASMQYMVNNSTATSPITVTVHPHVYAKLTGDTTNINPSTKITREVTVDDQIWTGDVELVFDLYCENLIFEPFDTIIIPDIINPGTNEPIRGTVDRVIDTTHKIIRVSIEKPAFNEEGELMFNTVPVGSKIMRVDPESTKEELAQWTALATTANSKNISFATPE